MFNACLRCSTVFVGLFSLIQALFWAGFSIWGMAILDCSARYPFQSSVDQTDSTIHVSYLFYLSYFRGKCANPMLDYEAPSAQRTYSILLAYGILSAIWVPTSVLLLTGSCIGVRGLKAQWIYLPWILVTLAISVCDIYATTVYAIDITLTETTSDYINFLNIGSDSVKQSLGLAGVTRLDGYTLIPAIVMTIVASRGVFLWLLNAFFLAFGFQGACVFSRRNRPAVPEPYHKSAQYAQEVGNRQHQWIAFEKPNTSPSDTGNRPNSVSSHPNSTMEQPHHGVLNNGFVIDEPLRLEPVEIEVKQQSAPRDLRYAEVEAIEMETTPKQIRHQPPEYITLHRVESNASDGNVNQLTAKLEQLEKLGIIIPAVGRNLVRFKNDDGTKNVNSGGESNVQSSESGSGSDEDEEETVEHDESLLPSAPSQDQFPTDASPSSAAQRKVYDVYGNPTEERLTPKVSRIQKILEDAASQRNDISGLNNKPFSYTQPLRPQVDSLPKKNDTVRGIEKPPIPVPDYSVRLSKKPSFRTPLPTTQ